jgi:hypothetical protein
MKSFAPTQANADTGSPVRGMSDAATEAGSAPIAPTGATVMPMTPGKIANNGLKGLSNVRAPHLQHMPGAGTQSLAAPHIGAAPAHVNGLPTSKRGF